MKKQLPVLVNKNRHLSLGVTAVVPSLSALCLFFHTTHNTQNSFQFPFYLMTSISTEPIFPLNLPYICQIWPSVFALFHGQNHHSGTGKLPERVVFPHIILYVHLCSAVCSGNLKDDFPHYFQHSHSMHSLDFITKSPNPHTVMPKSVCCYSYDTSTVMKQLYGESLKKCSKLLFCSTCILSPSHLRYLQKSK